MTQPVNLPIVGKMSFNETSKEKLLEFWQGVEKTSKIKVNYKEGVSQVELLLRALLLRPTNLNIQPIAFYSLLADEEHHENWAYPVKNYPKLCTT